MAKTSSATGGPGGVSSFDRLAASSYAYNYDKTKLDHYLYLAFEALCFACGCFTWKDIGMVTFLLQSLFSNYTLY